MLLGRLGSGGMGRVYLARSPGGRMVAVKVIRANLAEDAGFRARFAREVSAARKVGGMFTAQVVDADLDGPIPWLVTAYVPGTPLSDAVERQGPLPEASVLALAAGLAEGLIAIHAAGVIHRDLKPSNVLLAPDGPRIIDFGISSAAEATALTGTGFMIGSPGFMSPEQAEGLTVGPSSDIFSLAGVLIFAARGEGPFGTGDTAALLYRVVHGKPNMDHTPDKLRNLIKRSLSRDPKKRPSAAQFLSDLSAAYPSAADLTDWLPPRLLDPAMPGVPSHAGLPTPDPSRHSFPPGSGSIPPGSASIPPGSASIPPGSASFPPGSGAFPPGSGSIPPGPGSIAPGGTGGRAGAAEPQAFPPAAAAAGAAEIGGHAETILNPPPRTSHTPPPPSTGSQPPPAGTQEGQPYGGQPSEGQPYGGQSYGGESYGGESYGEQGQHGSGQSGSGQSGPGQSGPGQSGSGQYAAGQYAAGQSGADLYPPQQGYQQGYPGAQGYTGQQGWAGQQQYPEPQGYLAGRPDPVASGGSGAQAPPGGAGSQGSPWRAGQQPGAGGPGGPQMPGGDQWYKPPPASQPRKRPRWLLPAIAAAVILVVVVVLVLTLGSGSGKTPTAQQSATTGASASATPTVGDLLVKQYQVGDCLTGSNLNLNLQTPWPKVSKAVPCNQAHLAEVFYANLNFFAKGGNFPGGATITDEARAACDSAFQSYVGIAYSQSEYAWADIVPSTTSWPQGDRALHCVVYHATVGQPAGVTLYKSVKGSRQ
ncbi:MAG: protein kinase [Streptosporangiaceae bacterium]